MFFTQRSLLNPLLKFSFLSEWVRGGGHPSVISFNSTFFMRNTPHFSTFCNIQQKLSNKLGITAADISIISGRRNAPPSPPTLTQMFTSGKAKMFFSSFENIFPMEF